MATLKKAIKNSRKNSEWHAMSKGRAKYYVLSYIAAEIDESNREYYDSEEDAVSDANNMEAMQPENIYEVRKVEDGEEYTVRTISTNTGG